MLFELYTRSNHVAIGNIHSMTLSTDLYRRRFDRIAFKVTQDLRGLRFDLLFFTTDVWQHVIEDVERGDARIASTRNRLQCCCNRRLYAKCAMDRRERQY